MRRPRAEDPDPIARSGISVRSDPDTHGWLIGCGGQTDLACRARCFYRNTLLQSKDPDPVMIVRSSNSDCSVPDTHRGKSGMQGWLIGCGG